MNSKRLSLETLTSDQQVFDFVATPLATTPTAVICGRLHSVARVNGHYVLTVVSKTGRGISFKAAKATVDGIMSLSQNGDKHVFIFTPGSVTVTKITLGYSTQWCYPITSEPTTFQRIF